MHVQLKSIDIIDSGNKFLELIVSRIKDEIDQNPLVFGFDIEFETENKDWFYFYTYLAQFSDMDIKNLKQTVLL